MALRPSDIIQYKIRVREDLRRRLEAAAKKRDVSINFEMTSRLTDSFEREELFNRYMIAEDMKRQWARWSDGLFDKEQSGDLLRAAEVLVALLAQPAPDREVVKEAAAQVQKAIKAIKHHAEASARGPAGGALMTETSTIRGD